MDQAKIIDLKGICGECRLHHEECTCEQLSMFFESVKDIPQYES